MSKLDDFIIEDEPLGSGGQGCAFHARRIADNISVVLKKIHIGPILYDSKLVQRTKDEIIEWFTTLTATVKYMHDERVVHMDLKPQNVFFVGEKNETLKIGDFGVAKLRITTKSTLYTSGIAGTPTHLPPEAFDGIYGFKSDIWAMGVILFELVYLELPFPGTTVTELMKNIINNKRKSLKCNYSKLIEDLINRMLEPDQEKRPTIGDISVYTPQQRKLFLENQLIVASQKGDLPKLTSALRQGISVNYKDKKGRTALIFAATNGHLELVKHLLNAEAADLNCKTTSGLTSLNSDVRNGHVGVVKFLVSKGLDVEEEDANGMTPLLYATSTGNLELVKYLIDNGADVNTEDGHGWTALFFAARNGHGEVAKFLRTVPGIKVKHTDFKGRTVQWHEGYWLRSSSLVTKIDDIHSCLTAKQKSVELKREYIGGQLSEKLVEKPEPSTLTSKIDTIFAYCKNIK